MIWSFDPVIDSSVSYADGTVLPHRSFVVRLDGKAIGELELHTHKRLGSDGKVDVSYGLTAIVYGPPPGGK